MEIEYESTYEQLRQRAVQKLQSGEQPLIVVQELLSFVFADVLKISSEPDLSIPQRQASRYSLAAAAWLDTETVTAPSGNRQSYDRSSIRFNKVSNVDQKRIEAEVLAQYRAGVSYQNIQISISSNYKKFLDAETLSQLTDKLLPSFQQWQERQLRSVYVHIWLLSRTCHMWENEESRLMTIYSVIGIDVEGNRDVLGYYIDENEAEHVLPTILRGLKKRAVDDVLIMSVRNASALAPLIHQIFPFTHVHEHWEDLFDRNSRQMRLQDSKVLRQDLRAYFVSPALSSKQAIQGWNNIVKRWSACYPLVIDTWHQYKEGVLEIMCYPELIRKMLYSVNVCAAHQNQLSRSVANNANYATRNELLKSLYVTKPKRLIRFQSKDEPWNLTFQKLSEVFEERLNRYISQSW